MPSAPQIVYYITGLDFDQARTQDPTFVDTTNVRQRYLNPETGEYETTQGNAFTIKRLMPVPYKLSITVDIWTSSTNQKLEILEQLAPLFNPALEIQSNDNFFDWTSLSVVYQDGLTWTSKSIPQGTSNAIDVTSWKFYMPIWISSPVQVTKLGIIQKIIATIYANKALSDIQNEDLLIGTRQKITPYGYKLLLLNGTLQILPANAAPSPPNEFFDLPGLQPGCVYWHSVLNTYGVIRPGVSMIALENPYLVTEIIGTIDYDSTNDSILHYTIDERTLPQNTLDAVNSIINPLEKQPLNGLPVAVNGQRYLIVESIPNQIPYLAPGLVSPWIGLTLGAPAGSIIQYNDGTGGWYVAFNSAAERLPTDIQFVTNITSGVQYRFIYSDGVDGGWQKSYEGWIDQGNWRVIL